MLSLLLNEGLQVIFKVQNLLEILLHLLHRFLILLELLLILIVVVLKGGTPLRQLPYLLLLLLHLFEVLL
jgi:hypothetical protein